MRTLKWDPWFDPDVETTIGLAWISLPDLPPNFFAKEAFFSIASAVGKPLTVDMATKNKTRPSCAKVKIKVDLVAKLPQRVRINEKDDTGEIRSQWIEKQYDYMPKYYYECCLQGHDEKECWTIYPELFDAKRQADKEAEEEEAKRRNKGQCIIKRCLLREESTIIIGRNGLPREVNLGKTNIGTLKGKLNTRMKTLLMHLKKKEKRYNHRFKKPTDERMGQPGVYQLECFRK